MLGDIFTRCRGSPPMSPGILNSVLTCTQRCDMSLIQQLVTTVRCTPLFRNFAQLGEHLATLHRLNLNATTLGKFHAIFNLLEVNDQEPSTNQEQVLTTEGPPPQAGGMQPLSTPPPHVSTATQGPSHQLTPSATQQLPSMSNAAISGVSSQPGPSGFIPRNQRQPSSPVAGSSRGRTSSCAPVLECVETRYVSHDDEDDDIASPTRDKRFNISGHDWIISLGVPESDVDAWIRGRIYSIIEFVRNSHKIRDRDFVGLQLLRHGHETQCVHTTTQGFATQRGSSDGNAGACDAE